MIELPIRDDLLELIRPLELPACDFDIPRALGVLVLIELPMRDDLLELIRLPELLDGLRVLEVTPDRIVTGRLTDVLPDGLLVLPLLGMRTFTLLVILLEPVLRGELLRDELLRGELLRKEILLRLVEALGVVVLVGILTDRDEVVVLVGVLTERDEVVVLVGVLTDRDEVVALEEIDLLVEGCRLLEDEEGLETCRLLELLGLDLLLLLDAFSAKTGSIVSIRAKINVPTTILMFLGFFSVAIILLLKYFNVKKYTFETSSLSIKGTKIKAGNRNFAQNSLFLSFLYMENGKGDLKYVIRCRINWFV